MKNLLIAAQAQLNNLIAGSRIVPDGDQEVSQLQVTLQQAIDQADAPAPIAPIDQALASIAADVKALREAVGV